MRQPKASVLLVTGTSASAIQTKQARQSCFSKTGKRSILVFLRKGDPSPPACSSPFLLFSFSFLLLPERVLSATRDGPTTFLAFPAENRSGHFSTPVQEMPASFTSPSLKIWDDSCLYSPFCELFEQLPQFFC